MPAAAVDVYPSSNKTACTDGSEEAISARPKYSEDAVASDEVPSSRDLTKVLKEPTDYPECRKFILQHLLKPGY
jgi:hypothetical protein